MVDTDITSPYAETHNEMSAIRTHCKQFILLQLHEEWPGDRPLSSTDACIEGCEQGRSTPSIFVTICEAVARNASSPDRFIMRTGGDSNAGPRTGRLQGVAIRARRLGSDSQTPHVDHPSSLLKASWLLDEVTFLIKSNDCDIRRETIGMRWESCSNWPSTADSAAPVWCIMRIARLISSGCNSARKTETVMLNSRPSSYLPLTFLRLVQISPQSSCSQAPPTTSAPAGWGKLTCRARCLVGKDRDMSVGTFCGLVDASSHRRILTITNQQLRNQPVVSREWWRYV
nr:hypothetical protein CFP56_52150 [Quercus suber]